jgi:hypothetical protein
MARLALGKWLGLIGMLLVGGAIAWWTLLFPTVVENTGLSLGQALPCIASNSDICSLAMAICGGNHLFGIRHYSPDLFWVGAVLTSAGLLASGVLPQARR